MRTRTIEETVYTFDELSDKARDRAISDYVTFLVEVDWYEPTIDLLVEQLSEAGVSNPEILFSGFWSQGDGACFTGAWYARDCAPDIGAWSWVPGAAGALETLKAAPAGLSCSIRHRSHYYHEHSVSIDWDWAPEGDPTGEEDEPPFPDGKAKEAEEALRDIMRGIYRALETEYDSRTSVDAVREMSERNEWEYHADGRLA